MLVLLACLLGMAACDFDASATSGTTDRDGGGDTIDADPNAPDAEADLPDTGGGADPVVITLRDGVGAYSGTHDTHISQSDSSNTHGDDSTLEVIAGHMDGADVVSSASAPLLRFGALIGDAGNQVPAGAEVQEAILTLTVTDGSADTTGSLFDVLVDWDEDSATWDSFGPAAGMQIDVDYADERASVPSGAGTHELDVTASVAAWVSGSRTNRGWLLVPQNIVDRLKVASSEESVIADRPKLTVTFLPP